MEALELQPAGEQGTYFQKVPIRKAINDGSKSSLVLVSQGKQLWLKNAEDYVLVGDLAHTESSVEAPIVFVGYGVTAPELNYDDYAGADVRGKIVAMLTNAPAHFSSTERAYYADRVTKEKNAVVHGAIGVLLILSPEDQQDSPWEWVVPQVQAGSREWLGNDGIPHNVFPELQAEALLSSKGTDMVFAGAPKSLQQVFKGAGESLPQAFPLAWSVRMHTVNSHQRIESENVVGAVQGSDSRLNAQYVVYSAHLDHLGVCPAVKGSKDNVCHGTLDNASGVATALEIARAHTRLPQPPRRSILFLFVTGEEGNMEGSDYFAHYPTTSIKNIVADLNIDVTPGMRYPSGFECYWGRAFEPQPKCRNSGTTNGVQNHAGCNARRKLFHPFGSVFLCPAGNTFLAHSQRGGWGGSREEVAPDPIPHSIRQHGANDLLRRGRQSSRNDLPRRIRRCAARSASRME